MSKVITFSRTFPAYHPKAGQPTYFVNKLLKSFPVVIDPPTPEILALMNMDRWIQELPKHHTIRAGSRFKVGDKFSPRVWSSKPYNSKQIIIAPDIEIKKIWDIEIDTYDDEDVDYFDVSIGDGSKSILPFAFQLGSEKCKILSSNDGLSSEDLEDWFTKSPAFKKTKRFEGQIICWNENITY